MTKYNVIRTCFYHGERYTNGDVIKLEDDMVVHNYREMGYIGSEIKPAKRKGIKQVIRRAVSAK